MSKIVERYKAYDTYRYTKHQVPLLSQSKPEIYDDFYKHLEEKYNENWTCDAETKIKAQGLFAATKSFEHILAFSLVFNGLEEPLKPLVKKLQKRNLVIYKAYQMTDNVISELKGFSDNLDIEFKNWFNFAVKLGEEVNTVPSVPRLAKRWS